MNTLAENPELALLDRDEVCRLFGGTKPINPATLYRGIASGKYPSPVKDGSRSRWLKSECEEVLRRLIAQRDAAPGNQANQTT